MDEEHPASADRAIVRKRCGRPITPEWKRRGHHIGFYVTTAELEFLRAEARAAQADSLSDFARRVLCSIAARSPSKPHLPRRPDLDSAAVVAEIAQLGLSLKEFQSHVQAGDLPPSTGAAIDGAMNALGEFFWALADNADGPET